MDGDDVVCAGLGVVRSGGGGGSSGGDGDGGKEGRRRFHSQLIRGDTMLHDVKKCDASQPLVILYI